jgi:hypothetical protein
VLLVTRVLWSLEGTAVWGVSHKLVDAMSVSGAISINIWSFNKLFDLIILPDYPNVLITNINL